jgi:PTS system ascorbate-specific IIA component
MRVGLLIITHNDLGAALLETATKMLGRCPLVTETLSITQDADPEILLAQAQQMVDDLDSGKGVLVLTDMFGSTPANIASRLFRERQIRVVAGINLPMLVRVLNYPKLDLLTLEQKALSGGCDGVISCITRHKEIQRDR